MSYANGVPGVEREFDERGIRAIEATAVNVIGVVGRFERGPVGEAVDIDNIYQAQDIFGDFGADYDGMYALQAIYSQSKPPCKVVRVVGTGAAKATVTVQDRNATPADTVAFSAKYEGAYGNNLKVSVEDNAVTEYVDIRVFYKNVQVEFYEKVNMDKDSSSYLVSIINGKSQWITAEDKAPSDTYEVTDNPAVGDYPLSAGSDGTITEADYIGDYDEVTGKRTGLKCLETIDTSVVRMVLCAGQTSTTVNSALVSHAEVMDNRIAVLSLPEGTLPNGIATALGTIDSKRAIVGYPWVEAYDPVAGKANLFPPAAYMAGCLAGLRVHESLSNKRILGITGLEYKLTETDVANIIKARVIPITQIPGRGIRFRHGITTSSDTFWKQASLVRVFDKVALSVEVGLQWAISEPNTPDLWHAVRMSISNFLDIMIVDGEIAEYWVKCDADTNPANQVEAGILTVLVGIRPIYPADFIRIRISRIQGESVQAEIVPPEAAA